MFACLCMYTMCVLTEVRRELQMSCELLPCGCRDYRCAPQHPANLLVCYCFVGGRVFLFFLFFSFLPFFFLSFFFFIFVCLFFLKQGLSVWLWPRIQCGPDWPQFIILPPQLSKCWDHKCASPHSTRWLIHSALHSVIDTQHVFQNLPSDPLNLDVFWNLPFPSSLADSSVQMRGLFPESSLDHPSRLSARAASVFLPALISRSPCLSVCFLLPSSPPVPNPTVTSLILS